jgi:mono/diheme cytochrome c family protein
MNYTWKHNTFMTVLIIAAIAASSCVGRSKSPKADLENGQLVYNKFCLACHQANGSGVPGMYPPLMQTEWVEGDKARLIGVLLKGLEGQIEVNGQVYRTAMPPHNYLTNDQIADVLTFVRSSFGNKTDAITAEDVAQERSRLQADN